MTTLIINSLIYCSVASIALLLLLKKNPRFMLHRYPADIVERAEPKTEEERRGALLYGLPFILTLFFYPLCIGVYGKLVMANGFLTNLITIFIFFTSFNFVDLFIIDWLIICKITPSFVVIPGTEGAAGYKNYGFHFIAFLKGTVLSAVGALLFAALLEGMFKLLQIG